MKILSVHEKILFSFTSKDKWKKQNLSKSWYYGIEYSLHNELNIRFLGFELFIQI